MRLSGPRFTPEMFAGQKASGTLGDGTDDGPALAALSAALNAAGGGVIEFHSGRTYYVGTQILNGSFVINGVPVAYTFAPETPFPIEINGCARGAVVAGNGAKIKCLPGKRYGAFNQDGSARADASPFYGEGIPGSAIATPYIYMIFVHDCAGPVTISGLELDGNISNQQIGGNWGDVTRQLQMTGLMLKDNTGPIAVDVHSHHHGCDGGTSDGPGQLNARESAVVRGRYVNNGRNNWSHVGGNGWVFEGTFDGAGTDLGSMPPSTPGAGIDIEAEAGKFAVNTTIRNSHLGNCSGPGLLVPAEAANSFSVKVKNCILVGTKIWSGWFGRPGIVLENCTIVGPCLPWPDSANPQKATKFYNTTFTTDRELTPGKVGIYAAAGATRMMLFQWGTKGIYFENCAFEEHEAIECIIGAAVFDDSAVRFHNCAFRGMLGGYLRSYGVFSGDRTHFYNSLTVPDAKVAAANGCIFSGYALDSFRWGYETAGIPETRYPASMNRSSMKPI